MAAGAGDSTLTVTLGAGRLGFSFFTADGGIGILDGIALSIALNAADGSLAMAFDALHRGLVRSRTRFRAGYGGVNRVRRWIEWVICEPLTLFRTRTGIGQFGRETDSNTAMVAVTAV